MSEILYAEDEFTNRKLMEIQFQNRGISCDLAQTGQAALELFRQKDYRLIILDQYMPGYNGDELAHIFKKEKPNIPLIAITSDDEARVTLMKAGFQEVFIKPLRGSRCMDVIEHYLEEKPCDE